MSTRPDRPAGSNYPAGVIIEELSTANQAEARSLILAGLGEHWGEIDPTRNPDLYDMVTTYRDGRTILVRDDQHRLLGTGTVVPRPGGEAEILRMSVSSTVRRGGIGKLIVEELLATARTWGATSVVLETTTAWTGVVEFYLRCGFEITHTEPSDDGSDTWFRRALD